MSHRLQWKAAFQDVDGHAVAHVTKTDEADTGGADCHTRRLRPAQ
jgi:hypothetical protein